MPGTTILRIYNGDAAVKNVVLDVVFGYEKRRLPTSGCSDRSVHQPEWHLVFCRRARNPRAV
ncbi:hypothetical protein FAES_3429 [Fibrella aestuarina BUZ 2]|uniref:Uncharacterized protein n=1 Tax=Fibrella aestuarina BUZ 2 TaxID=1166018 RepID=I0KBD4_9BACT|nr:hypothetical protein FAES_3429 [Fibrella aestuarina BUZ 2]